MTVGLIVLDSQFASRKIQSVVLKSLYPERFARKGSKTDIKKSSLDLHYFELEAAQKAEVAQKLIEHNVICYCSYYYHDGKEKTHQERDKIYRNMVKSCILRALADHEEMNICIAIQGAAQNQRAEFIAELKAVSDTYREYRKVKYSFASNADQGVQLADFYVGATRDYFRGQLFQENYLGAPYSIIEMQVRDLIQEYGGFESQTKARG